MVDPIDPVSAKVNSGLVSETPRVEPVAPALEKRLPEEKTAQAAMHPRAERDKGPPLHEATQRPGFEMHLDGATLQVYSEMRDPDTRRVMLRIPAGYQPKAAPPGDYKPTEIET